MEKEEGIITKCSTQTAWVHVQQRSGCKTCSSHDTCDIVADHKKVELEAINRINANIGDRVEISMPEGSLLKLSFLVYLLPVVALVLGAVAGSEMASYTRMDPTTLSILSGFISMAIVFCLLKWFDRGSRVKENFTPHITRIVFRAEKGNKAPEGKA